MHTATARPEATLTARLAGFLSLAIVLFLAVFAAGYAELNLIAGTARVVVFTWNIGTSPWTYVVLAFLFAAFKILRSDRG